jgi:hypothetical protein
VRRADIRSRRGGPKQLPKLPRLRGDVRPSRAASESSWGRAPWTSKLSRPPRVDDVEHIREQFHVGKHTHNYHSINIIIQMIILRIEAQG